MWDQARLKLAHEFVEWLHGAVKESEFPATDRNRAATGCFGLAQEHHHAIVELISHGLYGSSFSLLRVEFEAYVRGVWLLYCASGEQIEQFIAGNSPPKIDVLIQEVEEVSAFDDKVISGIKQKTWSAMCAYTHTGGLHVQRWNTPISVEPSYDPEEVEEVLRLSEMFSALSAIAVADMSGSHETAQNILEKMESI